ncbi:hypothetical protein ISN75_22400 [Dyella marensis]|uniref:hypothetical protein n=1 Tax=Dyella TaxID=231454 RepID=UPI0014459093|nr:hypothetical protein [Dyella sp. SG609]NKJ22559.1 hypothetical protein [Dyella sp. SG609]
MEAKSTDVRRAGWLQRLFDGAGGKVALLLDHLKPLRVSLCILAFAVVVATSVDQAAELFLIAVWIDPSIGRYLALLASSALAGLAVWYGARNAYRLIYLRWPALQDRRGAGIRNWLPRIMGASIPLLVLLGYVLALVRVPHGPCGMTQDCEGRMWRAAGLLLVSLGLIVFFMTRRRLLNALPKLAKVCALPSQEERVERVGMLGRAARRVYVLSILANIAATVLIAFRPELLDGIGPLAILLIAAAFLALNGGWACMLADRRGFPLLTGLLALSALLHVLHLNDNHRVRQYPGMSTHSHPETAPADHRPSFDDYANAWLDQRCANRKSCPVVVAAAEGGGIRGAAWTALVLARLTAMVDARHPQQGEPLLARYLFAGSGVSGGSLGLATYTALLRQPAGVRPDTMETRARSLLDHDFLAPTLANMLFVDFTQRWLPGAWFDDRSRALTRAWEHAGRKQGVEAFAQPFAALYSTADGRPDIGTPALFLNSTTVAEGRRFIQHPFRPMATPQVQPWTAAFDGSAWLDPRVPLSEAVLDSARFTYVSPAGTLETAPPAGVTPPVPSRLQLVDGGYFENSGAVTLSEVMHRLHELARARGQELRFIVLHISNDPQMDDFVDRHDPAHPLPLYTTACSGVQVAGGKGSAPSGEATAPLLALLDTRTARGEYARARLLESLHPNPADPAQGDMLWHFRLCPGEYPIPLGWTISTPVFDEMQRQLEHNYPLATMAEALDTQLSGAP